MATVRVLPAEVENWIGTRDKAPRSEGAHVSVIVLSMLKEIAQKKYGTWGKAEDRAPQFEPGYWWEDILTEALGKSPPVVNGDEQHIMAQHEIVAGEGLEKVYGTPDHLHWHTAGRRFILDEHKATWYSYRALKETPDKILEMRKFDYWTFQAQTYAAMLHFGRYAVGATPSGRLHLQNLNQREVIDADGPPPWIIIPDEPPLVRIGALFINGTYRGDRATPYRCEIEWSEEELRTWWNSIKAHARRMAKESHATDTPEPPPVL